MMKYTIMSLKKKKLRGNGSGKNPRDIRNQLKDMSKNIWETNIKLEEKK